MYIEKYWDSVGGFDDSCIFLEYLEDLEKKREKANYAYYKHCGVIVGM